MKNKTLLPPWSVGYTLITAQTSRWSKEQFARNNAFEGTHIYAKFSGMDQGRSRICVATCPPEILGDEDAQEIAALIVRAINMKDHLTSSPVWPAISPDWETEYTEWWKPLLQTNGEWDETSIKAELHDLVFVMHQVAEVYEYITGGLLSKPMYYAEVIKQQFDSQITKAEEKHLRFIFREGWWWPQEVDCVGDCDLTITVDNIVYSPKFIQEIDAEEFAQKFGFLAKFERTKICW